MNYLQINSNLPFIFLFLILINCNHFGFSQEYDGLRVKIRMDDNSKIDEKAEPYIDQILASSQKILGQYNDRATLLDTEQGQVTSESIDKMRAIFYSNARVYDDLVQYGTIIALDDYIGKIRKYMNTTGPDYKITDLLLLEVISNPAIPGLYFETKIRVNKLMQNQIDEKSGKIIPVPKGGEVVPLEFVIIVQGDDLDDVKIYEIQGKIKPRPKPYNHEVFAFASMGFNTNTTFKKQDEFDDSFSPALTSKYLLDFGFKYSRSFKRGKHAKWFVGAAFGLHNWNINTENSGVKFNVSGDIDGKLDFNTIYDFKNVDNVINFSYLQAMLGTQIPLRPIVGYKIEYWVELSVMPTFVSKTETLGENKLVSQNSVVSFGDISDPFCSEDYDLQAQGLNSKSSMNTIGVQAKPYIRYFLNDSKTSGITFGVGYAYYFGSWIDKNSISVLPESGEGTVKSLLLQSFSPAHLRLELGLSFKL